MIAKEIEVRNLRNFQVFQTHSYYMHIWYLRRQQQGDNQNAFWPFSWHRYQWHPLELFQNRDRAERPDPAQVLSGVPLLLSVTILWIVFHTMWFQRCIFSIKANHYFCVPFVFVSIISYTFFINIYHSGTAVVKMRTFTLALLFWGANSQLHYRKIASELCRKPPWSLDTKFASFTIHPCLHTN